MRKLSVVIITYNEEKNVERCLLSLQNIADEIIVVDSNSTDKTAEICTRYNVNFYLHAWEGYIKSKNYANSLACNDLIFSIDADEVVSPELEKSILYIKQLNEPNAVYSMSRITNYCGNWINHCAWTPDIKVRIFDKNNVSWSGNEVHESLDIPEKFNTIRLKGKLLHFSYTSIEQHVERLNKYSTIAAKSRFEHGKKTNVFRIVIKPFFKFLNNYFIRLGFLDGYYGFVVCINSAYETFLKEIKLRYLYKK